MATFHLILASDHFLHSHRSQQVLRSTGVPLRSLSDVVNAEHGGHVPLRELLAAEKLLGFCILDPKNVLVVITEYEASRYNHLREGDLGFPIEMLGATLVVVTSRERNNPEAIATLLQPYGDFKTKETVAA